MRPVALVLVGAACSSQAPEPPEPPEPFVLEPTRERQMKDGFLRAPKAAPRAP